MFYFPIGFFKDPDGPQLSYGSDWMRRPDLFAVLGHFSFGIDKHIPRPTTYVTLLRDPVDRVLSLYFHLQAVSVLDPRIDIATFVSECPTSGWQTELIAWHPYRPEFDDSAVRAASRAIVDNDQTRRIAGAEPDFGECDAALLEKAKANLESRFSAVGTTERFDEFLILLRRIFRWQGELIYFPRLKNRSKPSTDQIPQKTRDLIAERNRFDVELYRHAQRMEHDLIERQGAGFQEEVNEWRTRKADLHAKHATAIEKMGIG